MEPSDANFPERHRGPTSHDATTFLPALAATLTSTPQSFTFRYLAEGNANVIYTLHQNPNPNSTAPLPPEISAHLHHAVLRLRKDLAFTRPCIEVLSAFREKIQPLFAPEHSDLLLEQVLVKLTGKMVVGLNGILHAMESDAAVADGARSRPMGRRGAYLPSFDVEGYGILMANLNALGGRVLEFKPKWLVQSPSAPKDAKRCRTCAVNLLRRMKGRHKGRGDGGFCPFALVRPDWEVLQVALKRMNEDAAAGAKLRKEFVAKVQPALMHLSGLQRQHGGVGLEDFRHPAGKDFGVAMALRDCSVFLVVSDDHILDVKFADLDLKTTEGGKVEGWAEIEEELILKDIYTDADGDESQPCHWSREVG